jgi:hypothetical protein
LFSKRFVAEVRTLEAMRTQAFFGKKRLADFQIFRGPIDRCAIGL